VAKATKTISLTGDHVFMPVALLDGGWETAEKTKQYDAKVDGKRQKYVVNAGLADFLIDRDQAMEVPD
jgi:hypothetical protein